MYACAALSSIVVTFWVAKKKALPLSFVDVSDIVFYTMIGGVIGGRLAYVLLYDPLYFWEHPQDIIAVWKGGMSIHGGFTGGLIAFILTLKQKKIPFYQTIDLFMPALALGLAFGRMGNFVNGELPGRITNVSWGMDFGDGENRHPSSLYSVVKDLLLCGIMLAILFIKKPKPGTVFGMFVVFYGLFRFTVEYFRAPDPQLGLLALGLSMGQWLSVLVILLGIGILVNVQKKK